MIRRTQQRVLLNRSQSTLAKQRFSITRFSSLGSQRSTTRNNNLKYWTFSIQWVGMCRPCLTQQEELSKKYLREVKWSRTLQIESSLDWKVEEWTLRQTLFLASRQLTSKVHRARVCLAPEEILKNRVRTMQNRMPAVKLLSLRTKVVLT